MNRRQRRQRARLRFLGLGGPPVVVAALFCGGLLVSPLHRERARTVVPTSPETLWAVLTDLDAMPSWRQDLKAVERLPNGVGPVRWRETDRHGTAAYEIAEARPPHRMVIRIADRPEGRERWIYDLWSRDGGTELRITEERTVSNPLVRALVTMFGADRTRIDGMARDLGHRLGGRRSQVALEPSQ